MNVLKIFIPQTPFYLDDVLYNYIDCHQYKILIYSLFMNDIYKRVRQTFLDLVAIDGIYPYEDKVKDYVKKRFDDSSVAWKEDSFGNIIVYLPGEGEPVMYSTHLDIPEPTPRADFTEEGDIIRASGKNILGADPKSGLSILIEYAIDHVSQDQKGLRPVELVLTRGEETGLLGARGLDYSLVSSKLGLVLDEDGPVTQVVTQAPAFVKLDVEFIGKIVHPREPEKGINALQMACDALQQLPWGYLADKQVTWNVGMFEAGTARNSVPGHARFKAELRSFDTELVRNESQNIVAILQDTAKKYGGQVNIENEFEFEGYSMDKQGELFAKLEAVYSNLGLKPNYFSTYGGTDANIFNQHGIVSVPIGSGYYNAHEYTEYVNIAEMVEIFGFLQQFSKI